jgi:two-component system, cell cycle sensor histidine kinase and response regulator CckA
MAERQATSVLIVDGEPLMRWAIGEALMDQGFDVVEVAGAQEATEALRDPAHPFDTVVLGDSVPDAQELDLLLATRRLAPRSHVIMLSSFMTPDVAAKAMALGASHVLAKPLELNTLVALIMGTPTPAATADCAARRAGGSPRPCGESPAAHGLPVGSLPR